MKLSILIPTYNRSKYLIKNLALISEYIRKGNYQNIIEIIVSNNFSTDDTHNSIVEFKKNNNDININYFIQDKNIGLEKNALFVLQKAVGEYVMYLGDDDYFDYGYLAGCLEFLNDTTVHCIIPANISIDTEGNLRTGGRDLNKPTRKFEAGFSNCYENAYRGHQLSGLVLKRQGLYNGYINNNLNNIYPFIYFVGVSCLNGCTIHYTEYPVKITAVNQLKKDWNYGNDGLLNEIFENYTKLPISYIQKTALQIKHYYKQSWRFWNFRKQSNSMFISAFFSILLTKKSYLGFKIVFPFIVSVQFIKQSVKKLRSK